MLVSGGMELLTADGPPGLNGPPLYFKNVPERVSLWWASKLNGGQSAPGADCPPANLRFVPERLFLWFGLKSELRTVRNFAEKSVTASF